MSISHVVSWYDLGNPLSWAIYLSVAIEIFALASVAASTVKMGRGSIYFLFGLVTAIQIMGNIFYEFKDINPNGSDFLSWIELIKPVFEDWDIIDHRRFLATIQGGTLPIMSLTALHFYIKFNDSLDQNKPPTKDLNKDNTITEPSVEYVVKSKDDKKEEVYDSMGIDAEAEIEKELIKQTNKYKLTEDQVDEIIGNADKIIDTKKENSNNKTNTPGYINKKDHRIGKDKSTRPQKNWGKR